MKYTRANLLQFTKCLSQTQRGEKAGPRGPATWTITGRCKEVCMHLKMSNLRFVLDHIRCISSLDTLSLFFLN